MKRALWAVLLLSAAACGEVDVTVARAGATVDGGALQPCGGDNDCAPQLYCSKSACSATSGTCQARPLTCDNTMAPVCGCDGVDYWNDCLRQRDGVPASIMGECATEVTTCDPTRPCPVPDAVCTAQAIGLHCTMPSGGICYVLPDTCPAGQAMDLHICGSGHAPCVDLCTAVGSGQPYFNLGRNCERQGQPP